MKGLLRKLFIKYYIYSSFKDSSVSSSFYISNSYNNHKIVQNNNNYCFSLIYKMIQCQWNVYIINSLKINTYKMNQRAITFCLILLSIYSVTLQSKVIYDFKKSYVTQLTSFNFKDQVEKIRQNTNYVAIVHYYKQSDGVSQGLVQSMDTFTDQFNGVFRVGAVDCDQYPKICTDQGIKLFPTFKVYPPVPMPAVEITEDFSIERIQKIATKYLHSNIIEITNANLNTFLGENPSVPKVLLFTDKKGTPSVYKGLSVAFQRKLNFGVVRSTDESLVQKYFIKKFPTIIVVKTGQKRPFFYKGKEFNFRDIFEFLNIYSEVFVPGGGSSLDSSATKEWMTETFPQMYDRSAKDICLATDGVLCVVLLTNEKPSKQLKDHFEQLNSKFQTKLDRGAKFKFMWLNAQVEAKWGELFGYQNENKVVIMNPGRRKRFTVHEGPIHKDSISQTLDAISGGDARFSRISELPIFSMRAE